MQLFSEDKRSNKIETIHISKNAFLKTSLRISRPNQKRKKEYWIYKKCQNQNTGIAKTSALEVRRSKHSARTHPIPNIIPNLGLVSIKYKNIFWIYIRYLFPVNKNLVIGRKCFNKKIFIFRSWKNNYILKIHLSNWDLCYMIPKGISQSST